MNTQGTIRFFATDDELLKERTYFTKQGRRIIIIDFLRSNPRCVYYQMIPKLSTGSLDKSRRVIVKRGEDLKLPIERPKSEYLNGSPYGIRKEFDL